MSEQDQIPRRGFLKIVGQAAAVGAGAPLLEVSNALATDNSITPPDYTEALKNPGNLGQIESKEFRGEVSCPVYMFHEVGSKQTVVNIIVENQRAGRTPVSATDLMNYLLAGGDLPGKNPYCLTFDDRLLSQWLNALPILDSWQIPATFVVMAPGWLGDRGVHNYMSDDQIREVSKRHAIVAHTINHPATVGNTLIDLRKKDIGAYQSELVVAKQRLEELIQRPIDIFASPASVYDDQLIQDIKTIGYKAALMTYEQKPYDPLQTTSGLMQIKRERRS